MGMPLDLAVTIFPMQATLFSVAMGVLWWDQENCVGNCDCGQLNFSHHIKITSLWHLIDREKECIYLEQLSLY